MFSDMYALIEAALWDTGLMTFSFMSLWHWIRDWSRTRKSDTIGNLPDQTAVKPDTENTDTCKTIKILLQASRDSCSIPKIANTTNNESNSTSSKASQPQHATAEFINTLDNESSKSDFETISRESGQCESVGVQENLEKNNSAGATLQNFEAKITESHNKAEMTLNTALERVRMATSKIVKKEGVRFVRLVVPFKGFEATHFKVYPKNKEIQIKYKSYQMPGRVRLPESVDPFTVEADFLDNGTLVIEAPLVSTDTVNLQRRRSGQPVKIVI